MMENFDAVVVGAGPAGCAAALTMARAGLNILVLERGQYVGAKNMWGWAFFGPVMSELFPGFWQEAPVELYINRHVISFMTKEDCLSVDFKSPRGDYDSAPGFIMLRAKFDRWMGGKKIDIKPERLVDFSIVDELEKNGFIDSVYRE